MTSARSRTNQALDAAAVRIADGVRLEQLDDPGLIALCLDGDAAAWEALIARYQRLVYSIPMRYGTGEEVASDVFQAVWAHLVEHLEGLKDRERLASWLITTATRECWRVTHRLRREAPIGEGGDEEVFIPEMVDAQPLAEDEQIRIEEAQRLREAVATLPDRSRELIELLYFTEDRPSYEEISRRLGIPVASIGPTRARALAKLRKSLA